MNDLIAGIRTDQRRQWHQGRRVPLEEYLQQHPSLVEDVEQCLDLIYCEVLLREELGERPTFDEYARRFPHHEAALRSQFELHEVFRPAPDDIPRPADHAEVQRETDRIAADPTPFPDLALQGGRVTWEDEAGPLPDVPGYEVLAVLNRGGWGIVYKARQLSLDRIVALKMLREDGGDGEDRPRLIRREAEAVARLQHPGIVQVHDFGEVGGRPFFAMELVEGGSLEARLKQGPLTPHKAAELVEAAARALQIVHDKGIVHRDLKPAKILLTPEGAPKVADFGLAKTLNGSATLAKDGTIVGTVGYMAPEQAVGTTTADVGPAADIFSLGTILYQCLAGRPPFRGETWWDTIRQVKDKDPPRLARSVARDLETVCFKCLEKAPAKRYASAGELAEDLRRFLNGEPVHARPRPWPDKVWRLLRARPAAVAAAFAAVGLAVGAMVAYLSDPTLPRREAQAALAAGHALRLSGTEPLPGTFRTILGNAEVRSNAVDRCVTIQAIVPALVEIVDDPKCDRYRFAADVRHDATVQSSRLGIYFGYRERRTEDNQRRGGYFTLAFSDRGQAAKQKDAQGNSFSQVKLEAVLFEVRPTYVFRATNTMAGLRFEPDWPATKPSPWRRLAVVVTPEKVDLYWEKKPGESVLIETFPASGKGSLEETLGVITIGNKAATTGIPTRFSPRDGLGLYVDGAEVSFQNIVLEPLPPTPE